MNQYQSKVKKLQKLQFFLILICAVLIFGFVLYVNKPSITGFVVRDDCGPIGGTISHSIDDEDSCKNACVAYCQSLKQEYHDFDFVSSQTKCNSCDCLCKE